MNFNELDTFRLDDAVHFHDELNQAIFNGSDMKPEVRKRLIIIAQDFIEHLGINDLDISDITISGSNAAYSYTKHSDIDLHIVVDMNKLNNDEVYRELFDAKKMLFNGNHDIKINGYEVELYVQDSNQPVVSLGEYSVMNDKWIHLPRKRRANFDQSASSQKYLKLFTLAMNSLKTGSLHTIHQVIKTIKKYRQAGLDKSGEFGPENLAYKALRSKGILDALYEKMDELHSKKLSLSETKIKPIKQVTNDPLVDSLANEFARFKTDEDYDPNGTPPGPEFKPTMPAGTVRVDVSDVYDWYKLGKDISDLDRAKPSDFGKGPPSTIMAFGSEEEEHKYIDDLKKLNLTTTDIDPVDPNQPKNMKRQKVDPTFNVTECSGYIPSEAEKNDPRWERALSVDVRPDAIKKNAKAFGFKVSRAGIPPLLRK